MKRSGKCKFESLTDAQVWQELKQGNKKALECLFFRHHPDLYRYAIKLVANKAMAKDHTQALFLKIWERRENLGDVKGVKTYLWTALRRSLLKDQQDRRKLSALEIADWHEGPLQFSAEEIQINREQVAEVRANLKKALNKLTPRQKEVLYLKFFYGMSYDEIEQIMSISYQTARNYVSEGLKALKVILESEGTNMTIQATLSLYLIFFSFIGSPLW